MNRTRTGIVLGVLLVALLALAACSGVSSTRSTGNTITLQNMAFNPSTLSVKVGQVVTFKNADQFPHHIVVGVDDLGVQQSGQTRTWKAPKDGIYNMKCLIHPTMSGQITVGSGGSTVGTPAAGGGSGGGSGGGGY